MALSSRLQHLLGNQGVMTGAQWRAKAAESDLRREDGEFEVEHVVPGEVHGDDESAFYLVRQDFPLDTVHGHVTLGSALNSKGENIALSANDEELEKFDPSKTVFVDTETTGLMGGTGTVTFLVGVGYFIDDVFRLDQCFMRDFDDEEPMLDYLDEVFSKADTVVSYNGKSFDVPLLRTRFITNRVRFSLDGLMHFDLVHAARRFWKNRLKDCSLGNVEREIMGVRRQGDVSGSLIPEIWLEYLHSRDARRLKPVFYHHRMDILSLVALTGLLSQYLDVPGGEGFEHHEDRVSLIRLHYRQKRWSDVIQLAEGLVDATTNDAVLAECLEMSAMASKRLERWEDMETTWNTLLAVSPRHTTARLELAKFYEHRKRDLGAAERVCIETLQYLRTRGALHDALGQTNEEHAWQKRLQRIQKKLKK